MGIAVLAVIIFRTVLRTERKMVVDELDGDLTGD
jgi:hypothetical protein